VVRCLALAKALQRAGASCTFVVEAYGAELLKRLGWIQDVVIASDEPSRLGALWALKPQASVVDDYRLASDFERLAPGQIMVIDDFTDRRHACALLLDCAYGRSIDDYVHRPSSRTLFGPRYALLREGFALRREPRARVEWIFVCFGLSDVDVIAARAVSLLRPLAPDAAFDVALASDAPSKALLQAMAASDPGLQLHLDADIAPLMHKADLGVGAGGGMVWERRAAHLPQLVVSVADNQRPMTEKLAADGVIAGVDLGAADFEARLQGAFTALLDVGVRRVQLGQPGADCDGRGAERAAQALIELIRG